MQPKSKLLLFLTPLCIAITISSFHYKHTHSDSNSFRQFARQFFASQITADTLSMHYTIAHPQNYGIKDYKVALPNFEESSYLNSNITLENSIHKLQDINSSSLSESDSMCYHILLKNFKEQLENQNYYYYYEPLAPNSGIQSQLPILLAEYYFNSEQDVQDYLSLLSAIPDYFSSIEQYETLKSKMGLFMPEYSANKLIDQCGTIINSQSVNDRSNFMITTFDERINDLVKTGSLSSSEANTYSKENLRLLKHDVIPAYNKLANTITKLKESGNNDGGLSHLPNGRDYYTYLVNQNTGSSKNIDSLKKLLQQRLRSDYESILTLVTQLQDNSYIKEDVQFPLLSPEAMLQDLQKRIALDFPSFPNTVESSDNTSSSQNYVVKTVSPCLEKYVSPAYYLTPPIDNMQNNIIYINENSIVNSLELYTTLAHEGYPGHLYQTVYFQLYEQDNHANPVRNLVYYGGYVEGWALYVENLSYEYAKKVVTEKTSAASSYSNKIIDLYRYDRDFQLCLYSILDIAIHYDGLAYEEVYSMLSEFGITDEATARNIYEYIVEEPTNYLKYYVGYQEILECKELVKEKMGSNYSDIAFHQLLLELGPMDFSMLKAYLTKYAPTYSSQKSSQTIIAQKYEHPSFLGCSYFFKKGVQISYGFLQNCLFLFTQTSNNGINHICMKSSMMFIGSFSRFRKRYKNNSSILFTSYPLHISFFYQAID